MPQAFRLDRDRRRSYYPLIVFGVVSAAACARYESIAPANLAPMTAARVTSWVADLAPAHPVRFRLTWRFANQQGESAGRAVIRLAPPDTLRFDYRGPFGRSGAAVVIANQPRWAHPEGDFDNLIRLAPLFWAALGIPSMPPLDAHVFGAEGDAQRAWRYVTGPDAIDFIQVRSPSERLLAEFRTGGRVLGASEVHFEGVPSRPVRAEMLFPPDASRFWFTIEAIDTVAAFDPETWQES